MLKIKLSLRGKKHQRTYRFVIAEAKSKISGKVVDDIGFYTPQTNTVNIDQKLYQEWLKKGATPTLGVNRLLNPTSFPKKTPKIKTKDLNQKSITSASTS